MRVLIVFAAPFAATVRADGAHWVRADVYFRGWYTERAVAVYPEGLREEARHGYSRLVHISTASQLEQLVTVLDLPRLHPMRGDTRRDTELVVDLFDGSGARTTYRGDNRYLFTADCTRAREVDEHFRKFFEQLTHRPNQAMQRTAGRSAFSLSMTSKFNQQRRAASPAVAELAAR